MSPTNTDPQLSDEACLEAAQTCTCFSLRRSARSVSQFYDQALQQTGLRATQFVTLLSIRVAKQVSIVDLSRTVGSNPSTLSRHIKVLQERGLVHLVVGQDRRSRLVSLTDKGLRMLTSAYPAWQAAQRSLRDQVGHSVTDQLMSALGTFQERIAPGVLDTDLDSDD